MGRSDCSGILGGGEFADCADVRIVGLSQFVFADVAGQNDGLGSEEEKTLEDSSFLVGEPRRQGRVAGIKVGLDLFAERQSSFGKLIARTGARCTRSARFLTVAKSARISSVVITSMSPYGINRAGHVVNICALKAADDLHDSINLADMPKELVAEPFSLARPLHEARYVNEFDGGRNDLLRFGKRGKLFQTFVGYVNDAKVGLDKFHEGEVCCVCFAGTGNRIE